MTKVRTKAFKSTKGITLIALVVTIIVLLILAGVSIAMLTGNNGILTQGKRAKEEQAHAAVKEGIMLLYNEYKTKQEVNASKVQEETKVASTELVKIAENEGAEGTTENLGSFKDFIQSKNIINANGIVNVRNLLGQTLSLGNGTSKESGDVYVFEEQKGIYKISYYTSETVSTSIYQIANEKAGKTLVEMYNQAQKDNCTNSDGSCTNAEHLHIGDYVNLANPEEGKIDISATDSGMDNAGLKGITAQTFEISKTNNKNQLNWRVLGENENGEIELIAGSPMKSNNTLDSKENPYLYLYGAKAYENGKTILDNICELYKTKDKTGYISSARSVNQKDIDKVVGLNSIDEIKNVNIATPIGKEYNFPDHYTPSSWLNGKTKTLVSGKSEGYGYTVNSKIDENAPSVTVNDRIFKMLFENTEFDFKKPTTGGRRYWLASRSVSSNSGDAIFCLGAAITRGGVSLAGSGEVFYSSGRELRHGFAVRPVVSLKSSVTNSQVQKITDKTEDTWNISESIEVL